MWIADYLTRNSITFPEAVSGNVVGSDRSKTAVVSSREHRGLKNIAPYGVISTPPVGTDAVVLPISDGEVCVGVVCTNEGLEPGELLLRSKGGASILLKNDGSVYINGTKFGGQDGV